MSNLGNATLQHLAFPNLPWKIDCLLVFNAQPTAKVLLWWNFAVGQRRVRRDTVIGILVEGGGESSVS